MVPSSSSLPAASPAPAYCGIEGDEARLKIVASFDPDSLEDDAELNALRAFAGDLCGTPIALVSLVEDVRQRFLSRQGLAVSETARSVSFCQHAMIEDDLFEVRDAAKDPRFAENVLVTDAPRIRFYAGAPLVSSEGAPLGALCVLSHEPRPDGLNALQRQGLTVLALAVMRRLEARRREAEYTRGRAEADRLLRESQRQFDNLADALPQMAWSTDAEGNVDYFNKRWYEFTGGEEGGAHGAAWLDAVHPDDRAKAQAAWAKAVEAIEPYEVEYRLKRHDGEYLWTLARGLPVIDAEGKVLRWFGSNTDIHQNRMLMESQELLSRELSHRIKNIFSVVTGLVSFASRSHPEMKPVATSIGDRINALGRAHNYVRPMSDMPVGPTRLNDVLADLFAPYAEGDRQRVRIEGGAIDIVETSLTPFALVFHELATNAVKYGALSADEGHVELAIREDGEDVLLEWRERGGPPTAEPDTLGFGSDLLKTSLLRQLKGSMEQRWLESGLELDIRIPRERVVADHPRANA